MWWRIAPIAVVLVLVLAFGIASVVAAGVNHHRPPGEVVVGALAVLIVPAIVMVFFALNIIGPARRRRFLAERTSARAVFSIALDLGSLDALSAYGATRSQRTEKSAHLAIHDDRLELWTNDANPALFLTVPWTALAGAQVERVSAEAVAIAFAYASGPPIVMEPEMFALWPRRSTVMSQLAESLRTHLHNGSSRPPYSAAADPHRE